MVINYQNMALHKSFNRVFILLMILILIDLNDSVIYGYSIDKEDPDRPNILFILADDLGLEYVGAYGNNLIETPNIDRLADEGMMFTNMFVNPYCTPTRSELLTGRYPFRTNTLFPISVYQNHKNDVLDKSEPSLEVFPLALRFPIKYSCRLYKQYLRQIESMNGNIWGKDFSLTKTQKIKLLFSF